MKMFKALLQSLPNLIPILSKAVERNAERERT